MKVSLLSILISFFLITPMAFAQQLDEGDFLLNITPENPGVNQKVTATLQSYSTDINNVLISWTYGGMVFGGGIGKRTIEVQAGKTGERKILEAAIYLTSSTVIRKSIVITHGNIELLWESLDAYAPPFYKGKPLVSSEGMVRVSTFPERATTARGLIYGWSKNGIAAESVSGYGKIGFLYKNDYLNPSDRIEVEIRHNNIITMTEPLEIGANRPSILFYKKVQGFRDYATALVGVHVVEENTEIIVAEPYYFSISKTMDESLETSWLLGKQDGSSGNKINELVISKGTERGSTEVEFMSKHKTKKTQFSERSLQLAF